MGRSFTLFGATALAFVLALGACQCQPPGDGDRDGDAGPSGSGDAPDGMTPVSEEPAAPPATLAELAPVIRPVSDVGVAPTKVVIELARPVGETGKAARPGTVVEVVPALEGAPKLRWTTPSTLELVPSRGAFENGRRYEVTLRALELDGVVLRARKPWTHAFETPRFGLARVGFARYLGRGRVELDVVFSGPVEASAVASRLSADVGGVQRRLRVEGADKPNRVRATLSDPTLGPGRRLSLRLASGVPSLLGDVTAGAASESLELPSGKAINILGAHPHEGARGFLVHVVCSDDAARTQDGYYWDDHVDQSFQTSGRCVLDERAARDAVHFEPAVENVRVAPTRAGFHIQGDFKRGSYSMRIDAGVVSVDGGLLHRVFEAAINVPARAPNVRFIAQGRYLPRSAWRQLAVQHTNLNQVELRVRHVRPENLVFWLSGHDENAGSRTSELIAKKAVAVRGEPDQPKTTWLDLADLVPGDTRGVLEISASGRRASTDSRRLVLTDMNLVAKKGDEGAVVWAFGIHDNQPINGVEVKLVTESGLVLDTCRTRDDGGCQLDAGEGDLPRSPFAIIATKGKDLTYIKFDDLRADVSEYDTSGAPWSSSETSYRAAAWSDRGVYRPGETAHVAALLRGEDGTAPKAGMPVEIEVMDPRDQVTERRVEQTSLAGVVAADLRFGDFATTGKWSVRFRVGKRTVGSYDLHVEEFVPERMKVTAEAQGKAFAVSDVVPVDIEARYLFGGSAGGSRYELKCDLLPATFRPPGQGDYQFDVWHPDDEAPRPMSLGTATGELDDEGRTTATCPAPEQGAGFAGPARVRVQANVFEAGSGRSTLGEGTARVHPERFYLGLKTSAQDAKPGTPIEVEGVAVDWDGKPVADVGEVRVALYRVSYEYGWTYDEGEGRWRNRYHQRTLLDLEKTVKTRGGRFKATVTPSAGASLYLVRATAGEARTDVALESQGYYYWWSYGWSDGRNDRTPRPSRAARLDVTMPEEIRVGQPVEAKLTAPYPGRLLFTVETDRIVEHAWRDVKAGEVKWSFTPEDFTPNVYLSALLIKDPHLDSKEAFTPDRAFGVRSARVVPERFVQDVKVSAPKEVRSQSKLTVTLDVPDAGEGAIATVAVVDEGILQLTKFKSPDPLATIFARRRLGVETFETVGWNLLLPAGDSSSEHGGGAEGDAGRVQPIKPVALWSGVLEVPASGKLEVPFDVPQYRGALRVMVVTSSPKKVGRAEAKVLVRDPIVLQTTLPRFLVEGDVFDVPVFLTNVSGKDREVKVTLRAESLDVGGAVGKGDAPPIALEDGDTRTVKIADGKSATVTFRARAARSVGAAKLKVTATSPGVEVHDDLDVPFSPQGPRVRRVVRKQLDAETTDVKALLDGWVPTTERTTIKVTQSPYGDAFDHLRYLVRYPYGCIEQTTSSTRPLLYLRRLVALDPTLLDGDTVEQRVQAGLVRVLAMQTPSGGFAYWPGGREPTHWATAYATHMLLDAKELKYAVPQSRLNDVLAWMERELTHRIEVVRPSAGSRYREYRNAEPYFHYVLARAGKARPARVEKLIKELEKGTATGQREEHLYLLKAALWHAGDRRYESALRNPDVSSAGTTRRNNWSFYSDRRRRGLMLTLHAEMFGADPSGAALADVVAESLRGQRSSYYTTQELVWGVTGLARRLQGDARSISPARLTMNGKVREPASAPPKKNDDGERAWDVNRASEQGSLSVKIASADVGKAWLILSSEGQRTDARWQAGAERLDVERRFYDAEGGEVRLSSLNLGDVVYVAVTVGNDTGAQVNNLALVDRLPAGFEIENPRLGRGGAVDLVPEDELWTFDHMNVRDDRVEVFGSLPRGARRTFVYVARAVTAGSFTLPPVEVEAMYVPSWWARQVGGRVTIAAPWER